MAERQRKIGAYIYPQGVLHDQHRINRANKYGYAITNETVGSGRVLLRDNEVIREWSDENPEMVGLQMKDAKAHGIDTFFVCTYPGVSHGENATEFQGVVDVIAQQAEENDMNYALMMSLKRPPNRIPYPVDGSQEPNRYFDLSKETLYEMIDFASKYWKSDQYLKLYGDQPLVMVYGITPHVLEEFHAKNINAGVIMKTYCQKKYGVTPYLVAVADSPDMAQQFKMGEGFTASASYAGLPTFHERALRGKFSAFIDKRAFPKSQYYNEQLANQFDLIERYFTGMDYLYYPSAVAGWDPIRRCDSNISPNQFPAEYPYYPRILDSTPEKFLNMMVFTWLYYQSHYWNFNDQDQFPHIICSWNDIGDGTDILRRIKKDGTIDNSYLEAVKTFASLVHSPVPLAIIKQLAREGKIQNEIVYATERVFERKKFMREHEEVMVRFPLGLL